MKKITAGVHTLLNIIYRETDLMSISVPSSTRLETGVKLHQKIQNMRPGEYDKEVRLDYSFVQESYELVVKGRADGIYRYDNLMKIEEIKTTYRSLEELSHGSHPYYEDQLKLYMYFLSELYPEKEIKGVLTYVSVDNLEQKELEIPFDKNNVRNFFVYLAHNIIDMVRKNDEWQVIRDNSIEQLVFPFENPRDGQKDVIDSMYSVIEEEKDIIIEAPTGIGKTIALLFPSIKKLKEHKYYEKIFFLTAKTSGQNIVSETLEILQKKGLHLRSIFLNAKEKMCFCNDTVCNPELCEYAKGYYEKTPHAVDEILPLEIFTREKVMEFSEKYNICPFEFSLDLSLVCDLIICDYNYVFDPRVYLKRYFGPGINLKYMLLIDEAHNLVERGRSMHSPSISKRAVLELKREMKGTKLFPFFDVFNRQFISWDKEIKEDNLPYFILSGIPECYEEWKEKFFELADEFFRNNPLLITGLRDFYYEFLFFTKIMKISGEDFRIFVKKEDRTLIWKIFCLNPGRVICSRFLKARTSVFFSATLSPSRYFREYLGIKEDVMFLQLPSPFPVENALYLHVPGISTTYKKRMEFYDEIAEHIVRITGMKKGNYLCFFPSYNYLQEVYSRIDPELDINIYIQERGMSEDERNEFLENFTASYGTNLGFAVMGGIFGEGIDLAGDRLIGAIIVGVGLPMVDEERNLISGYFEEQEEGKGFLYAYMIPGMIRVIQSAGRVFRTPEDKGLVVLMDDRFRHENYRKLLPKRWLSNKRAFSTRNYERILKEFWIEVKSEK